MPPQRNNNNNRFSQKPYDTVSDFKNLHVRNLPENCTEDMLKEAMSKYGKVESVRVPLPGPNDKNHRGYGFVTYSDSKGAKAALEANNVELNGHTVIVAVAGRQDIKARSSLLDKQFDYFEKDTGKSSSNNSNTVKNFKDSSRSHRYVDRNYSNNQSHTNNYHTTSDNKHQHDYRSKTDSISRKGSSLSGTSSHRSDRNKEPHDDRLLNQHYAEQFASHSSQQTYAPQQQQLQTSSHVRHGDHYSMNGGDTHRHSDYYYGSHAATPDAYYSHNAPPPHYYEPINQRGVHHEPFYPQQLPVNFNAYAPLPPRSQSDYYRTSHSPHTNRGNIDYYNNRGGNTTNNTSVNNSSSSYYPPPPPPPVYGSNITNTNSVSIANSNNSGYYYNEPHSANAYQQQSYPLQQFDNYSNIKSGNSKYSQESPRK